MCVNFAVLFLLLHSCSSWTERSFIEPGDFFPFELRSYWKSGIERSWALFSDWEDLTEPEVTRSMSQSTHGLCPLLGCGRVVTLIKTGGLKTTRRDEFWVHVLWVLANTNFLTKWPPTLLPPKGWWLALWGDPVGLSLHVPCLDRPPRTPRQMTRCPCFLHFSFTGFTGICIFTCVYNSLLCFVLFCF